MVVVCAEYSESVGIHAMYVAELMAFVEWAVFGRAVASDWLTKVVNTGIVVVLDYLEKAPFLGR